MFRVGQGYDVHRLEAGRDLWIGGVQIPFPMGLSGHSDADVLLHAICDAVLGAVASGDIGLHFPDSDSAHRGRASREFLQEVREVLVTSGWSIGNIDATVIAEKPKLAPYVDEMRKEYSGGSAGRGIPGERQSDHHRRSRINGPGRGDRSACCGDGHERPFRVST